MTLSEIIFNIENQDEEFLIFAKKLGGKFLPSSEVAVIAMSDDENGLPFSELSKKYCPGGEYFLEVFIVKDMIR